MPHSPPWTAFRSCPGSTAAATQDSVSPEADGKCPWQAPICSWHHLKAKFSRLRRLSWRVCPGKHTDWNCPLRPGITVNAYMSSIRAGGPGRDQRTRKPPPAGVVWERSKRRCQVSYHLSELAEQCRSHQEGLWVRMIGQRKPGTKTMPIKPKTVSHVLGQFCWVPLPSCSPPLHPFPIKSLSLSARVSSWTIRFWVSDKSHSGALEAVSHPVTALLAQCSFSEHSLRACLMPCDVPGVGDPLIGMNWSLSSPGWPIGHYKQESGSYNRGHGKGGQHRGSLRTRLPSLPWTESLGTLPAGRDTQTDISEGRWGR